jgi:hypothetical protein
MPTFQITTCPSCQQEFEFEIFPLPCLVIYGDEEKEICPLCHASFDGNDKALKFRFRRVPNPKKLGRLEKIKTTLKKFLHQ